MTAGPLADRLAAYLAEVRELPGKRREMLANWWAVDGMDLADVTENLIRRLPHLAAAVEAAMRFHAPQESADGTRFCVFCSCATGEIIKAPCPETEAITRELLGEEERP